jgi:putative membrane protein
VAFLLRIITQEEVDMRRLSVFAVGTAVLAITAAIATAQGAANPDQKFVMEAAGGGAAEVELGKLATERATNPDVKSFGQRMVDDHSKAGDELKVLAATKKIALPTDLDPKEKALRDRLTKLQGAAFDRAYMDAMVKDHETDVRAFQAESKSGRDPEVKAWAAKTLPTLEEHLRIAREADRAVGTSGKK